MSSLECKDAELCIEILDNVSCDPHLSPPPPSQIVSSGHRGAQAQDRREASLLRYTEATCWDTRATARFDDDNRKD